MNALKSPLVFLALIALTATSLFAENRVPDNRNGIQEFANPPFHLPAGVVMKADIVYAAVDSQDLHLDLFLPAAGSGPFPAVIYVHGGLGSSREAKAQFHPQAAYMASKGFAGACVQYRKLPEARYPAAIFDLKAAIRWLRANAAKYHIDPDKIGAAGGSGGGNLVGMLGTTVDDPAYEGTVGDNLGVSSRVSAVAAFNPAVDLVEYRNLKEEPNVIAAYIGVDFAEHPQIWVAASPIYHVGAKSAPFLFLHGDADADVPYRQSTEMADRLRAVGVRAEIYTAPGAGHGFFNSPPWFEPTLKRMEGFFSETLH